MAQWCDVKRGNDTFIFPRTPPVNNDKENHSLPVVILLVKVPKRKIVMIRKSLYLIVLAFSPLNHPLFDGLTNNVIRNQRGKFSKPLTFKFIFPLPWQSTGRIWLQNKAAWLFFLQAELKYNFNCCDATPEQSSTEITSSHCSCCLAKLLVASWLYTRSAGSCYTETTDLLYWIWLEC